MKVLTCFFSLVFISFLAVMVDNFIDAAAPPVKSEKTVVYLKPVSFKEYKFKNGSKGFTVRWDIKNNQFSNKKVPNTFDFYFYGPQPIRVEAYEITGFWENNDKRFDRIEEMPAFPAPYGRFWIMDNAHGREMRVVALFDDPVERYEKKWKDFEMKIVGKYADKEEIRWRIFQKEVMKIKGVVGCGSDNEKPNNYTIAVAKGHPQLKEVKEKVEKLAKKQGMTVVEWDEREGHDYLWKKK